MLGRERSFVFPNEARRGLLLGLGSTETVSLERRGQAAWPGSARTHADSRLTVRNVGGPRGRQGWRGARTVFPLNGAEACGFTGLRP
jgi:hypothetical protein